MSGRVPSPAPSPRAPRRILVIRPDRVGDVVLATPVIRALRRHFPDAFLAAMVRPATEPVLRGNPHLDEILIDDWEQTHAGTRGALDRRRLLRARRFDTALMLLPTERHAWMTVLAGIRTRIGVGTKLYQVLTFTRTVSPLISTVTPLGTVTGNRPTRDTIYLLCLSHRLQGYQTLQRISPPTPSWRARWPVITPLGVERMATPIPESTHGISVRRV